MRVRISFTLSAPSLQELQRREIVFPLRLFFLGADLMLDIPDTALDLLLGRNGGFFRWDAAAASSPADSGEPSAVPETSATSAAEAFAPSPCRPVACGRIQVFRVIVKVILRRRKIH